jgi:SAM-dependent methyltransferase
MNGRHQTTALFADGEAYERVMGRWSRRVAGPFLDWVGTTPGLHWLDVGCGNGAFTEDIVARCAPLTVTGIDPSEPQLTYARTRGLTGATFRNGDAQALPFNDDAFDIAAMALVIVFLPDPARAVAEMARVVRSGGMIATYMWDVPGGGLPSAHIAAALKSMGIAPTLPPNPDASREPALQAIWRGAGLTSVETRPFRISIAYSDFEEYWTTHSLAVGPSGQAIQRLDAAQKDNLKARLRALLSAEANGPISYEACANAVKGRVP